MIRKILVTVFTVFMFSLQCRAEEGAGAYILMEQNTRQIIKCKNENMTMPIASTTKIMTAIIAAENADPEDVFTVSENAQNQEGSSIYLREGDRISVKDLLYGLLLNSGNDAAVALSEGVSGSTDEFVRLMNDKAREIGCKNTSFKNPSGLCEEDHYSTAYDLALITAYAKDVPLISEIMATKFYNIEDTSSITYLKNHNKLLWQYKYCTGGKTGFTKLSGRCLATTAEKDGVRLVAVTLNCPDDWRVHRGLLDYGFESVSKIAIIEKGNVITTRTINGTKVDIIADDEVIVPKIKRKGMNVTAVLHLKDIRSGVSVGDFLGKADIYCNGYYVARVSVKSGQKVNKAPFSGFDFFRRKA